MNKNKLNNKIKAIFFVFIFITIFAFTPSLFASSLIAPEATWDSVDQSMLAELSDLQELNGKKTLIIIFFIIFIIFILLFVYFRIFKKKFKNINFDPRVIPFIGLVIFFPLLFVAYLFSFIHFLGTNICENFFVNIDYDKYEYTSNGLLCFYDPRLSLSIFLVIFFVLNIIALTSFVYSEYLKKHNNKKVLFPSLLKGFLIFSIIFYSVIVFFITNYSLELANFLDFLYNKNVSVLKILI